MNMRVLIKTTPGVPKRKSPGSIGGAEQNRILFGEGDEELNERQNVRGRDERKVEGVVR